MKYIVDIYHIIYRIYLLLSNWVSHFHSPKEAWYFGGDGGGIQISGFSNLVTCLIFAVGGIKA